MMTNAKSGDGTLGLAARNDLAGRFAKLMASKDTIVSLLSSGDGSVARLRTDSALMQRVTSVQARIDSLKTRFAGGGAVSRLQSDSSLTLEMAKMKVELAALMADIKKNPRAYISF
jgi:hypothetical protein